MTEKWPKMTKNVKNYFLKFFLELILKRTSKWQLICCNLKNSRDYIDKSIHMNFENSEQGEFHPF